MAREYWIIEIPPEAHGGSYVTDPKYYKAQDDLIHVIEASAVAELVEALECLRDNGCFCEVSIGNPMMSDHSYQCKKARAALKKYKGSL